METIGVFEAKQRLSELVERAKRGERIGITRHGKLQAVIVPAAPQRSLAEIFESLRGSMTLPRGATIRQLIEEGRR